MPSAVLNRRTKRQADNPGIHVTASQTPIELDAEVLDLVCHTTMPLHSAIHRSHCGKDEFYFCSLFCQHRFVSNPIAYVPQRAFFDQAQRRDNDHAAA